MTSRRTLLRSGAAAAAGSVALGGRAAADHNDASTPTRQVDGDSCLRDGGDELWTGDALILNNDWATGGSNDCPDDQVDMCISTYGDGSFGWEWARYETCIHGEDLPNYPQALIGQKIGGTGSGWGGLPEQNGNIDEFDVHLEVEQERSDGEWNFMLEWWMEEGSITGSPTDEILIVLEASDEHDKGEYVHENAIEDDYGNTIHYWENEVEGGDGADWNFHIFHLDENEPSGYLDLRSVLDYLVEDPRGEVADGGGTYDGRKLVSGVEIGNETWDNTDGETIVEQFNVRVNGQVGSAGVEDGWIEPQNLEPSSPGDLAVTDTTDSSVSLSWSAASDPDGSVDHYVVEVEDRDDPAVPLVEETAGTEHTVSGLASATTYGLRVAAVDDEGHQSDWAGPVTATTDDGPEEDCATIEGQEVCSVWDDEQYRDFNSDGSVTQADVTEFFTVQHKDGFQNAPGMFDYNGNGGVGLDDVVYLFQQL